MRNASVIFHLIILVFCCILSNVHPQKIRVNLTLCDPVSQHVGNRTIWWGNYSSQDFAYSSKPICLNDRLLILKRYCTAVWLAEPTCDLLQEEITPCPENFLYHKENEICYTVLEDQTFPPDCPYPGVMSFYKYKVLLEAGLVEAPVWLPAKSMSEYGVGAMTIIEPTEHYGNIFSILYYWRSSFQKDCLVYTSSHVFDSVYCNSTYNAICAYHPLQNVKNNYCSRNQSRPCVMSDFDPKKSKCLCVRDDIEECPNLAEMKLPHQNFISTNGAKCSIGLKKRDDGKFIWATSGEELSYTNWSIYTNFYASFGAIESNVGWSLEEATNLSCAICEEDIEFRKSSLSLTLDDVSKHLILTVTNIQDLVIPSGKSDPVFCFSDTATTSQVRKFSKDNFVSIAKISDNKANIRYQYSRICPGHYWCEAFQYPDYEIIRTNKILVLDDELYGNEFVTTLLIRYTMNDNPSPLSFFNTISVNIKDRMLDDIPFYMRWMSTLDIDVNQNTIKYLVHITSKTFNPIVAERDEFSRILSNALGEVPTIFEMSELLNVKFCLPDTTNLDGLFLHWPLTEINAVVTPFELCLQDDGTPVTRGCYGDFLNGASWMPVDGSCSKNPLKSPATEQLYNLMHSNESFQSVFRNLAKITERSPEFLAIDVHFVARIFDDTDKRDATDFAQITTTVNNILNASRSTLKSSQFLLNATDEILYNFDILLRGFYKERQFKSPIFTEMDGDNLITVIFDARNTPVRGIGLYKNRDKTEVRFLEQGTSYDKLISSEDLEVATYIPEDLVEQISTSLTDGEPLMVAIYVFMNDYLFNENKTNARSSGSKIFGVLLPIIDIKYVATIPIIFKPVRNDFDRKCAFWNYGATDEFGSFRGRWEEEYAPVSRNETNLELCQFAHTTHFALLLLGDLTEPEQDAFTENQTVLTVITTVGCGLSIFGIIIILLTFLLFKRWRESKGNQILVQFGLVTILQICLLYTSSQIGNSINKNWCVLVGALLHFAVLSQFCWMLVMAILQYRRFVLVFSKPTKWLLLKSCILGYVIPAVPVIVYVTVFNENYVIGQIGMCYPSGDGLLMGVILPGGCIILANLVIFLVIIWNIFYRKLDSDYSHDYALTLRLRLVFVLFFMLGITWVFGFVAEITHTLVFVYLFCSTASLQGFIMFFAFVVCNENTRRMYIYLFKTIKYRIYR